MPRTFTRRPKPALDLPTTRTAPKKLRAFAGALALAVTVGVADRAAADPTGVTDLGIFGEGAKENVSTSATGAMTYAIPFRMPPSRGKVGPALGLTYDSSSGDREAGMGWGLSLPSIERVPTSGWPRYADGISEEVEDRYAYNGERLQYVCTVGAGGCDGTPMPAWATGWRYYKAKIASADLTRFFLKPGRRTWKVQLKGGVIRELGEPETAAYSTGQAFDCANNQNDCSLDAIFRWRLSREVDRHENTVVYKWERLGTRGLAYLTDVWNVSHAALGGLENFGVHAALSWEGWGAPTSYAKMDRARPDLRLKRVTVATKSWQGDQPRDLVAAYHLSYLAERTTAGAAGEAPLFGHTFLASVKTEACAVQEDPAQERFPLGDTLCPGQHPVWTKLRYSEGILLTGQHAGQSQILDPPALPQPLQWPQAGTIIDLNGDGLPDALEGWEFRYSSGYERCGAGNGIRGKINVQRDANGALELMCVFDDPDFGETSAGNPLPAHKAFINRGTLATGGAKARMQFRCVDGDVLAQVHSPGPGQRAPNQFLNGNGRTFQGGWGEGIVAFSAPTLPQGQDPAFAAFALEAAPATAGCPGGPSAGYRWVAAPPTWYRAPFYEADPDPGAVPPTKTYVDIDGDGLVDRLTTRGEPLAGPFERMDVAFTRRYVEGEAHGPYAPPGNVLTPFSQNAGTSLMLRGAGAAHYVDVNGDGTPDLVHISPSAISVRPGDGRGGFGCDDRETCAPLDAGMPTWLGRAYTAVLSEVPSPFTFYVHDINGDGLADLIALPRTLPVSVPEKKNWVRVWLNQDGHNFVCPFVGQADPCMLGTFYDEVAQAGEGIFGLTFADMNGDGVDDIVMRTPRGIYFMSAYVSSPPGAPRPGLLVGIDHHGRAETSIEYSTVQQLDLQAEANAGTYNFPEAWATHSPRVDTVVTRVITRDKGLAAYTGAPPAPLAFRRATTYAYQDPMFDPWTRRLLGFKKIRRGVEGQAAVTETTYWFGKCHHTFDGASGGARDCAETSEGDAARPQPYRPGLPVRVDRFIPTPPGEPATWLSSVTLRYDGWNAISQIDTFLFDANVAVTLGGGAAVYGVDNQPFGGNVPGQAGSAHLVTGITRDADGNVSSTVQQGNVAATPPDPHRRTVTGQTACDADWVCVPTTGADQNVQVFEDAGPQGTVLRRRSVRRFDAFGDLVEVLAYSSPSPALTRAHVPTSVTADDLVTVAQLSHDGFGNETFVRTFDNPGSCTYTEFDAAYAQFPATRVTFNHDCAGTPYEAFTTFDRRFGQPTMVRGWDEAVYTTEYDRFGRPSQAFAPDAGVVPSVSFEHEDRYGFVAWSKTRRATANDAFHEQYVLFNGLSEPAVAFDEADAAQGDGGSWVRSGFAERNEYGQVVRTYRPDFTWTHPVDVALAAAPFTPASAAITMHHDSFGRATGIDHGPAYSPTPVSRVTHRATSVEVQDAEQIAEGAGHKTTIRYDGHGRAVRTERRTATHDVDLEVSYEITGEPRSVVQRDAATQATVTRTLVHDERGRLITNDEPNSGIWEYRYDDGGRLVATSDARGCGANYHYDGFGRILAEDDVPCEAHHQPYSAPELSTGDGAEVFYRYDTYEPDQLLGPSGDPRYSTGRLVSIKDRGGHTRMSYDVRGRVTKTERRAARPGVPSDVIDDRYTPHWYERSTIYDLADRVTSRTTGADVPELMGAGGVSYEAFTYSRRGVPVAVETSYDGAYGPLLHDQRYNASGQPLHWEYGDASSTLGEATYDPVRGWLSSYVLFRGVGPWATEQPGGSYSPPDPETTPVDLARVSSITRDAVGNPLHIPDTAQGWVRAGSKPATRTMAYDGFYRVTSVTTSTGGDEDVSPFDAEVTAGSAKPVPYRRSSSGVRPTTQTYAYDWLGNTTQTSDDANLRFDRSLGAVTNSALHPNQLVDADGMHADYDAAGNLVSLTVERPTCDGTGTTLCTHRFVYDWDETNQLVRARRWDYPMGAIPVGEPVHPNVPTATPAWDLELAYSAGARIRKSATDAQGITRHSLEVFDSLRLDDAAWETDDYQRDRMTETALVAGIARVAYDPNAELPTPTGSLLHLYISMGDHLGSTTAIVERDTGEVVERAAYHPYGQLETDYRPDRWGAHRERIKFTGKEEDIEVGLTYFGARYYHARLGRWLSPDPLAVHGLGADLNVYAYVGGQTFAAVDPWGLCSQEAPGACIGGAYHPDAAGNQSGWSVGDGNSTYSPSGEHHGLVGEMFREWVANGRPSYAGLDWGAVTPELSLSGPAWDLAPAPGPIFDLGSIGAQAASAGGVPTFGSAIQESPSSRADWLAKQHPALRNSIRGAQRQETFIQAAPLIVAVLTYGASAAPEVAAEAGAGASARAIPGLADIPANVAVPVRAGEPIAIPRALAPSEMAALTNTTGNIEFSQTFANGQHWLTRADFATPNRVLVRPWVPGETQWISHSHPAGFSGMPSAQDRMILNQLGQRASRVVRPNGSSLRFGQ